MQNSRTKNSKRNIISGVIKQISNLVLAFVIRTLILYLLGAEYQGLSGLFASILQVLNLVDLGFSTAVTFILYKPIALDNKNEICAILNVLRKIYIAIGCIITILGVCIMPFIKMFVNGSIPPDINIYILFLIYLSSIAISYFMFAYKNTLLSAEQREDVISNIYTITSLVMRICQMAILLVFRNYMAYITVIIIEVFVNNLLIEYASRKMYPDLVPKGKMSQNLKKKLFKQVQGVFIGKLSDVARNSLDNIIISLYLGLVSVAIYGNYFYIYTAIYGFMGIIIHGISASVGNSIATESIEKNQDDMRMFNFIFMIIVSWCTVCMYCLYQPFMRIWMHGNEAMMLTELDKSLFCIYFYSINMTYVRSMYLDGKGLFYECRYWCIIEALGNLLLNIILGKYFGITGILWATIITIVVCNFIGRTNILYNKYFKRGLFAFYLDHIQFIIVTVIVTFATKLILDIVVKNISDNFLLQIVICSTISASLFIIIYFKHPLFKKTKKFMKKNLNN